MCPEPMVPSCQFELPFSNVGAAGRHCMNHPVEQVRFPTAARLSRCGDNALSHESRVPFITSFTSMTGLLESAS
jgi:hypothetical protein